ncbi:M56 family metallopeptidase [Spirosoma daeguense]
MNALTYFLIASLYLLLFYGCYVLLLRRNTFFGLNRAYLLGSVMASLVLPFVQLPNSLMGALPTGVMTLPTFVVRTDSQPADWYALTTAQWLWILYGAGVVFMVSRLIINMRLVMRLIRQGAAEQKQAYTLVRLVDNVTPSFSFGTYLVLNQADARNEPDALLRHEEAHIRQRHTVDVVLLEVVQALFWFNPVLIFYKRALQEVHEFLADRAVLQTPQPDYPRQLVAYALNVAPSTLVTSFASKSTLKQRIVMLQKPTSHRRALFGYVLALPLAASLLMCTQSEQDRPLASTEGVSRKSPVINGDVLTIVEEQPEFPGGMKKLGEFLGQNLKYPEAAQKAHVEGKVFVSFVVTKTGEITNVQIEKGIGFGADAEAVRVVKAMPRWSPARHNGEIVNVKYNLPIRFVMEDETESQTPPPPPPVEAAKKTAFFSIPTDIDVIQKSFNHFIVDGEEVAFNEFKSRFTGTNIVEASSSEQAIKLATN